MGSLALHMSQISTRKPIAAYRLGHEDLRRADVDHGRAGCGNGDHSRRPSATAATAAFSVAASTVPVIRIRGPAANSISIDPPLLAGATGQGVGPDSATTIAGTKPG
jgi:hypothetical protein